MFGTLLFRWRFVIHGGIDGFSQTIVFLRCSTNNRASTVFDAFQSAVEKFGLPSRVRSDKGKENTDVAWFMLSHPLRGLDRGSHITGRSVHNQRIERLWRDMFSGCIFVFLPFVLLYGSMRSSRHHKRASFGCTPLCVLTPY